MSTGASRYLIVNADDFGQSRGVNDGVIAAHEHGIVTSASLMVRWDAAAEAAAYARSRTGLSVGLHFDIGEWAFRDGQWTAIYEVASRDDGARVATEAAAQLERFRDLMGRDPSHIDSHQHVHSQEPIHSILRELAGRLGVPLRDWSGEVRYSNAFYGQLYNGEPIWHAITPERLIEIAASLRPGVTELGCHPGRGVEINSMYLDEREIEVKTLCHPVVRARLDSLGVELCTFDSRPRSPRGAASPVHAS